MEYSSLVEARYSVRKFRGDPVDAALLGEILRAARLAPTAVNKQPFRILVIQSPEGMEALKQCTPYTFGAPMALVVCENKEEAWVRPQDGANGGIVDASIVGTHILLAVHNVGLGSTWVGYFDPALLSKTFALPPHIQPVAIFPIGHPAEDAKPAGFHAKRRPLEELVVHEHF